MKVPKLPKIILRATLLVAGAGLLIYFIGAQVASSRLPDEFVQARQSAAAVTGHIVALTKLTSEKLAEVNLSDLAGETSRALSLISDARAANDTAYRQAFELTQHLKNLAESLAGVSSPAKQREGSQAVAIELSLVSEFIVYTQKVDAFLNALARAVETNAEGDRNIARAALDEVNAEVVTINSLNQSFLEAIGQFDASGTGR